MNIQEAIDAPRIHHQWMPDQIDFERFSLSNDVKKNLEKRKHILGEISSFGRAEGILIDQAKKIIWGATDPRGYGKAAGY
jgi:gamma-glutamyltranspeptidase/glutathione hydrolase